MFYLDKPGEIGFAFVLPDRRLFTVAEFTFLATGEEAYGMTKYYMILGLGTLFPSFVRVIYAKYRNHMIVRLIDIWENDLTHPPYPQDREVVKSKRASNAA